MKPDDIRTDVPLEDFIARHAPALSRNEPRHIVILGLLGMAAADPSKTLHTWSFDDDGACAVLGPGKLILGDLDEPQCAAVAEATAGRAYPGVVGPDRTAEWFVARATELGLEFELVMPQRIYELRKAPRFPDAPGAVRPVTGDDTELLGDWVRAFVDEAVPNDPMPPDEAIARMAASGNFFFWEVEGSPVSMAAIVRETEATTGISMVYTPPDQRARGYAGAATAAVVEHAFARGKTAACLFTDLRNPLSNRCYIKIGFEPVCDVAFFRRVERRSGEA